MRATRKNLEDKLEALVGIQDRHLMIETWHGLFDRGPPKNISLDLMRRAIAYRMQEQAIGGLKSATRRYLQDAFKKVGKEVAVVKLQPLEPAARPGALCVNGMVAFMKRSLRQEASS